MPHSLGLLRLASSAPRLTPEKRLQLLESNLSPEQQAKLRQLIEEAEFELQKRQLDTEIAHSRDFLVWTDPASVEQLQKQMAQSRTVLAEFLLGENRSYVWLFAHGKLSYATLPPRRDQPGKNSARSRRIFDAIGVLDCHRCNDGLTEIGRAEAAGGGRRHRCRDAVLRDGRPGTARIS